MKKIIGVIIVLIIIGLFCVNIYMKNQNNGELENSLKPIVEDYFEKYMNVNSSKNIYKITLQDLRKYSNEYDLQKFSNCSKQSYVNITIDYKTGKILKYESQLDCK